MKNVYDGVVVLDNKGKAEIQLPNWFGALSTLQRKYLKLTQSTVVKAATRTTTVASGLQEVPQV